MSYSEGFHLLIYETAYLVLKNYPIDTEYMIQQMHVLIHD